MLKQLPRKQGKSLQKLFQGVNTDAVDLLKKMLMFNPNERITVEEALQHPYLSELHIPDDEPSAELVNGFDFDFELYPIEKEEYKQLIYDEI